jgi:hypothetical protein
MRDTIEAFVDCVDGKLSDGVDSQRFFSAMLEREVDRDELRKIFNNFHALCPNFKEGEDDCPDCLTLTRDETQN